MATHRGDWHRLEELCRRRHLTGAEADEILDLYQRVATHLSLVRSTTPGPLARGLPVHAAGPGPVALGGVARVRVVGRRALLRRSPSPRRSTGLRWWWITVLVVDLLLAVVVGWWLLAHPTRGELVGLARADPPAGAERLRELLQRVRRDLVRAARVDQQLLALGAVRRVGGASACPSSTCSPRTCSTSRVVGSIMIRHGRGALFFGLISPHGMLELTASSSLPAWGCGCSGRGSSRGHAPGSRRWGRRAAPPWPPRSGLVVAAAALRASSRRS